jgi:hypothetical protein
MFPTAFARAHSSRTRPAVRLATESLEARDCPSVTATFNAGVLTVVGDSGGNAIRVSHLGTEVLVVGDGERHRFEGVEEIVIDSGDGDDHVVVMENVIAVLERGTYNLGRGADTLDITSRQSDDVNLKVLTADGGDEIAIGLTAPAGQKVRAAAAAMSLELGGPGNVVDVEADNFDAVEFAIRVAPEAGGRAVPGDRLTLDFDIARPGGQAAQFPSLLSVEADLADGDDHTDLTARGFVQAEVDVDAGAGRRTGKILLWVRAVGQSPGASGEPTLVVVFTRTGLSETVPASGSIQLVSMGYDRVATEFNTGPAGAGADRILALHVAEGSQDLFGWLRQADLGTDASDSGRSVRPGLLLQRLANPHIGPPIMTDRALLDDGLDEILTIAAGYESSDIKTEQTRQVSIIQDV